MVTLYEIYADRAFDASATRHFQEFDRHKGHGAGQASASSMPTRTPSEVSS